VAELAQGFQTMGIHTADWNMGHLPAGLYLVRLRSPRVSAEVKVVRVR
jgi:hypothetical protein